MEELEEDRLSSLPKIILHSIMSELPEKDAARTSVLSKAWSETWYTFPILSFSTSKFIGMSPLQPMEDSEKMRKMLGFCDYVKRTILRFCDQNLAIKEFKLKVNISEIRHISRDVDFWLKLACECGVEVIEYSLDVLVGQDQYHVLPMCVIEAKSITKLVLKGYIKIDPTFMNHSIKFTSLRVLSLQQVLLGDQHAIDHLISFCPLLESITLMTCFVLGSGDGTKEKLKSLSISGLQKLESVDVVGIKDVSIDAPSLETLCYSPIYFDAPFKIDFDRCKNLKELCMLYVTTSTFLTEQFPKFPFLEILKLSYCKMSERINISSVRLKVLVLSHCSNLKEVNIDARNLLSFGYIGHGASLPTISFLRNSCQLEVNIWIHVDYVDLCNLRKFMQNIKPNNVLTSLALSITNSSNDALDPVASHVSFTPTSIKHLTISHFPQNKYLFSSVVKILLASCFPETISLSIYSGGKEFIEFFYDTLMRRKEGECFCSFHDTKCWWHDLKDVKVTRRSMKMDENVDFKTILESLTDFESIIFRLVF
ncbi:F-box protein At1g60400-like [Trifolium pratense]|uniref:F-box protein At1g60400-like n=1 Tax=Trifolium pratense TaxID=57577 RepID=UPI001E693013|nr:F-box protein At1g60400-like [Trifolium pratense]XP_045812488.1 F-box protein At1g60400-like [Trifolium pratense]